MKQKKMTLKNGSSDVQRRGIVHRQALLEPKVPYDNVVAADFADLEGEASAKSCYSLHNV